MSDTIWVEAGKKDRSVALSETDELHPGGEAWVVGYPNESNPVEVGRTPEVMRKLISKDLVEVAAPAKKGKGGKPKPEEGAGTGEGGEGSSEG